MEGWACAKLASREANAKSEPLNGKPHFGNAELKSFFSRYSGLSLSIISICDLDIQGWNQVPLSTIKQIGIVHQNITLF